jgi:CRP-like cAMP-binding protein
VRLFSQDTKVATLKRTPLFRELSRKELEQLAKASEDMEFPAGKVLCRQGDVGREFFAIVEGEVEVTRSGETIEPTGGGDFFGEIALIEKVPRTATVTAKTPLRAFVLTRQAFQHLLDANPEIERKVLRALAKRVASLAETR